MRADSAGATHELIGFCRDGRLRFSVGFDLTEPLRTAILALAEDAWAPALTQDGQERDDDGARSPRSPRCSTWRAGPPARA